MTDGLETSGADTALDGGGGPDPEVARLWLAVLRTVADRAAHELRGALNGVSVNLEVARTRAMRAGADPAGIAPFAGHAAEQLDVLTERVEALLATTRRPATPFDVRIAIGRLATLLAPAARGTGGDIRVEDGGSDGPVLTSASGEVARLVLAALLVSASDLRQSVVCRIVGGDAIIVQVEGAEGLLHVAPEIVRVAADAGIGVELTATATNVAFPAERR